MKMFSVERGRVSLLSMEFYGYHGCLPEERGQGQHYYVDLDLFLDLEKAASEDVLEATVDYSKAFEIAREVVEGEPRNLIESVAYEIARKAMERFSPDRVCVRVRKPNPPVGGRVSAAEVEVSLVRC